jgi:RNA polymerase sigma factor (sigma-70 family)
MAGGPITALLNHLFVVARSATAGDHSDQELLGRFVAQRDEGAFAALLQRHGPMVLGVCRGILRDKHEAEDAFQATFLVLARKAGAIRKRQSLAGWLHGVAARIALRSKAHALRRPSYLSGTELMAAEGPQADLDRQELHGLLHEELRELPDKYRLPLVLCYLQGKTHARAGAELGLAQPTVTERLGQARERLRRRLLRRGATLSSASLAAILEGGARAHVPAPLGDAVLRAALGYSLGPGGATGASTRAVELAEGVLPSLTSAFWTRAAILGLCLGLLAGGGFFGSHRPSDSAPENEDSADFPAERSLPRTDRHGDPLPEGVLARLGTNRWRPRGDTVRIGFVEQGRHMVSVHRDGTCEVWELPSGKLVREFGRARPSWAWSDQTVALSANGEMLAVKEADGAVQLWDVRTGRDVRQIGALCKDPTAPVALSAEGKLLAAAGPDRILRLWDTTSGREVRRLGPQPRKCGPLAFTPDGNSLLAIDAVDIEEKDGPVVVGEVERDWILRMLDASTGKERWRATERVQARRCPSFSADGSLIVYCRHLGADEDAESELCLRRADSGKIVHALKQRSRYGPDPIFSADGSMLAWVDRGDCSFYDTAAGTRVHPPVERAAHGVPVAFTPDGKGLVTLGTDHFRLWDLATGNERPQAEGHHQGISDLAISPDGRTVTTCDRGGLVRQWQTSTGKPLRSFALKWAWLASLSPGGRRIAMSNGTTHMSVLDTATGKEVRAWTLALPEGKKITGFAISADNQVLAAKHYDWTIQLWDMATGRKRGLIRKQPALEGQQGGDDSRYRPVFSPDGQMLADTVILEGRNSLIQAWDARTCKQVQLSHSPGGSKGGLYGLCFSPDGHMLASFSAPIGLWETATGQGRGTLDLACAVCAFAPDGRTMAAVDWTDGSLRLVELPSGKEIARLRGHRASPTQLAFSADGTRLVSAGRDTTALVWDLTRFRSKTSRGTGE